MVAIEEADRWITQARAFMRLSGAPKQIYFLFLFTDFWTQDCGTLTGLLTFYFSTWWPPTFFLIPATVNVMELLALYYYCFITVTTIDLGDFLLGVNKITNTGIFKMLIFCLESCKKVIFYIGINNASCRY